MIQPLDCWPRDGTLRFRLEIPKAYPSNNEIKGMNRHVYKGLRRSWCLEVLVALGKNRPTKPLVTPYFLLITRECSGSGLDWDNAYGGLKPLLDCLVLPTKRNPDGLGVVTNDDLKHMPFPPFVVQVPSKINQSKTTVDIYELNI